MFHIPPESPPGHPINSTLNRSDGIIYCYFKNYRIPLHTIDSEQLL